MKPLELAEELLKPGTVNWEHLREAAHLIKEQYFALELLKLEKAFNSFEHYE